MKTNPLEFGIYDPLGANADSPLDAVGGVSLICAAGTAAKIAILPGTGKHQVAGASRAMAGRSDLLGYEIYKDPERKDVWSGLGSGAFEVPADPTVMRHEVPIYGRIPAGQDVIPGPYADLATVLVEF